MALILLALLSGTALADRKAPSRVIGSGEQATRVEAPSAKRWMHRGETVILIQGETSIRSGATQVFCQDVVLFLNPKAFAGRPALDVYAEKNVSLLRHGRQQMVSAPFYARIPVQSGLVLDVKNLPEAPAPERLPLYARALMTRYPDEDLPWKPPTEQETLFSAQEFRFRGKQYTLERVENVTRVILHGDVLVETQDAKLYADDVVVWMEPRPDAAPAADDNDMRSQRVSAIYGRGAVTIVGNEGSLRADEFYLDAVTSEGMATNVVMRTRDELTGVPLSFQAPLLRQLDRHTLLAREGAFSTTHFIEPNYAITGQTIRVTQGTPQFGWAEGDEAEVRPSGPFATAPNEAIVVASRQNWLTIGGRRIFYVPFLAHDVRSGGYLLRRVSAGSDGEFGVFIKTAWNPYDLGVYRNDWSDVTLNLDYYSKRGPALGVDVEYEGPSNFGFFTAYAILDGESRERDGQDIDSSSRGRVLWRHRQFLGDGWRADFEFAYRTDRNILPVYFQKEFEEGKAQETLAYLRKIQDNWAATGLINVRINDFDTYVERLPEFGFHWLAEPFMDDRILYTQHARMSYLRLRFDKDLGLTDPDATFRMDTQNEIALPLQVGDVWIEPYAGVDLTLYSNDATGGGASMRFAGRYGFRAGTNFHRTYDMEDELFDIHGLRHVITPIINYEHVFAVSQDPLNYTQYDGIDSRDQFHHVLFRLRNRLQTMRGEPGSRRSVDFLTVDFDYNFYPGAGGANAALDDFIQVNARWVVNEILTVFSRDNIYNVDESRIEVFNVGFEIALMPPVTISFEHDFVWTAVGPDRSIATFKLVYRPEWSRWQLELEQRYDFNGRKSPTSDRDPKYLTNVIAISRDLNGWRLILDVEFNRGVRGDTRFGIQLEPTVFTSSRVEL